MRDPWKHPRSTARAGRRKLARLAALACVAATVGALWVFFATRHVSNPLKVADVSGRPTACLASDSAPSSAATASHLWSVMRHAVSGEHVNVQQIQVPIARGGNAEPYLAGLVNQRCDLVVTIGEPFGQAVSELLRTSRRGQFLAVDSGLAEGATRLTLADADTAPRAVQAAMTALTGSESKKQ